MGGGGSSLSMLPIWAKDSIFVSQNVKKKLLGGAGARFDVFTHMI